MRTLKVLKTVNGTKKSGKNADKVSNTLIDQLKEDPASMKVFLEAVQ